MNPVPETTELDIQKRDRLQSLGDMLLEALSQPYTPDPEWKKLTTKEKIKRIAERPFICGGGIKN